MSKGYIGWGGGGVFVLFLALYIPFKNSRARDNTYKHSAPSRTVPRVSSGLPFRQLNSQPNDWPLLPRSAPRITLFVFVPLSLSPLLSTPFLSLQPAILLNSSCTIALRPLSQKSLNPTPQHRYALTYVPCEYNPLIRSFPSPPVTQDYHVRPATIPYRTKE